MTEAEIAARVAFKLTGKFYIGQRVRHVADDDEGVIKEFCYHFDTPSTLCAWERDQNHVVAHLANLRAIDEHD